MAEYSIHEVVHREELDALIDVCWKAWWDPYLPNIRIAFPIFGYTAEDRTRAIAASKDRFWGDYEKLLQLGQARYIYAKHNPSGEIVGGLRFDFATGSSFPDGCPKVNIYWWPEGEVREFCQEMMQQAFTPRSLWMSRPHGYMYNFVVHPKHRGRGVGTKLLEYNSREFDAKGVEGFVEASELGRPAYERAGYQVVMKIASYIPADKRDNDDWKRWYHEMGMIPIYAMWRPKYGKVEPGERAKPWQ